MGLIRYAVVACTYKECFVPYGLRRPSWIRFPFRDRENNIIISRRKETNRVISQMTIDDDADEKNDNDSYDTGKYNPPKHNDSFLRHLESVKSSWPFNDKIDEDDADPTTKSNKYRVYCTGEPSIDPSRMLQSISDDDYDWI